MLSSTRYSRERGKYNFSDRFFLLRVTCISLFPPFLPFYSSTADCKVSRRFPEARRISLADPIASARDKRFARWEKLSAEGRQESGQIERDKGYDKSNYLPLARSGKDVVGRGYLDRLSTFTFYEFYHFLFSRFQGENLIYLFLSTIRHEIKSVKNYCN